ncbi:MAG TPA: phosphoglycerate dehydrogenase [Syntrophorhabdaceae bacterium]|nr:phosphoglycerate dehydrogenase [Syntrophorhabdaceae bacterium]
MRTNNIRIVVTSPSFSRNATLAARLLRDFPQSVLNVEGVRYAGESLLKYIEEADGIIVGLETLDERILKNCPNLKIVSKYGVGLDNVDLVYCKENNIRIGWTPGVNKRAVAEMTLAFMIGLSRNIFLTANELKEGNWNKSGGMDLSGKTVGIIGVGNIGKEVVKLLKPFRCRVMVNDIIDQSAYYKRNKLEAVEKDVIYSNSDVITIHTPLTDATWHIINRQTLSKMKKNAFVINSARGAVVNTDDLKWALANNIIAGAAVDVYEEEPPSDPELFKLPNLICTPHIGGNSAESVLSMGNNAIKHLRSFFKK